MPKIQYKEINFRGKSLELINLVNQVVEEYQAQGYELTLRQAYYQLVARGYIPNNERSYKNIGNLINDGRLAGLIDWHSITDRTRNLRRNGHWDNPADVIASARYSYLLNKWDGQPNYVEVWVEKDALVDIVGQACRPLDTPYFSCRGYTSQSEMWSAAQRFISQDYRDNRVIIHLGDHDPIDDYSVWIAENITPVTEAGTDEQPGFTGYEYDLTQYTKDEYIKMIDDRNASLEDQMTQAQEAMCEIYEMMA